VTFRLKEKMSGKEEQEKWKEECKEINQFLIVDISIDRN